MRASRAVHVVSSRVARVSTTRNVRSRTSRRVVPEAVRAVASMRSVWVPAESPASGTSAAPKAGAVAVTGAIGRVSELTVKVTSVPVGSPAPKPRTRMTGRSATRYSGATVASAKNGSDDRDRGFGRPGVEPLVDAGRADAPRGQVVGERHLHRARAGRVGRGPGDRGASRGSRRERRLPRPRHHPWCPCRPRRRRRRSGARPPRGRSRCRRRCRARRAGPSRRRRPSRTASRRRPGRRRAAGTGRPAGSVVRTVIVAMSPGAYRSRSAVTRTPSRRSSRRRRAS